MTVPANEVTPVVTEPVVTEPVVTEPAENPAWKPILDVLPDSLHNIVKPGLKSWDENFTKEVNKVKEQYAPYKDLVDNNIDGAQALQALQVLQAMETDPAAFVKAIQEAYNLTPAEAKQVVAEATSTTPPAEVDPVQEKINQLEAQQQQLAKFLTDKETQAQQAANMTSLQSYLAEMKEKYPQVPEDIIIPFLANGKDGEDAAKAFMAAVDAQAKAVTAPNLNAPVVLGASGGLPSNQQDISKMSDKDIQALTVRMLQEAKQQT